MDAILDPVLLPAGTYDLIRLGGAHDGGYLVDPRSVDAARRLISFGLSNDWSFEEAFRARNPVPVDVFDHTVSRSGFLEDWVESLPRLDRPDLIRARWRTWRSYRRFFQGDVRHHRIGIGYDWLNMKSLPSVLARLGEDARPGLFLSIDIEGWEYRILDDLVALAPRIEGLCIEFHDLDLCMPRLLAFAEAFPLNLCHIHANNVAGQDPNGTPLVLELSFTRHPPQDPARPTLPHPLDTLNEPRLPGIPLTFGASG